MKAKYFLLYAVALFCPLLNSLVFADGHEVSWEQAIDYVRFIKTDVPIQSTNSQVGLKSRVAATTSPLLYSISLSDGSWYLLPTDDRVQPILAMATFEDGEDFDLPAGMLDLIADYENSIIYLRDSCCHLESHPLWQSFYNNGVSSVSSFSLEDEVVLQRLDSISWNQSYNNDNSCDSNTYNQFCPDFFASRCGRTYVGCTAVAMGQIIRYWQWPYAAYIPNTMLDTLGNTSYEVHIQQYDFSHIPYALNNSTRNWDADNVAILLKDCGYSCEMKYGSDGSSASLKKAAAALCNIWGYGTAVWQKKLTLLDYDWIRMIKSEIDANRPLLYAGYNSVGGHAFVVYGYNSSNLFKINWGYGSTAKTWCALGAFTTPGGKSYNSKHECVRGIEPTFSCEDATLTNFEDRTVFVTAGSISVGSEIPAGTQAAYISGTMIEFLPNSEISIGTDLHFSVESIECIESE